MAGNAQNEVDALFKDLDSFPTGPPPSTSVRSATPLSQGVPVDTSAIQALAELDDLAKTDVPAISAKPRLAGQGSSSISRPSSRTATERVSLSSLKARSAPETASFSPLSPPAQPQRPGAAPPSSVAMPSPSSWGWGSVWGSASVAYQQARNAVDEGVKNLPNVDLATVKASLPNVSVPHIPQTEHTKQWREGLMGYVKNAQLDKLSQDLKAVSLSTLNDILNAVAPPIAEHEVIQVWLSHDLEGYDGVETLVYRALARILEQVEGGDLIVNKGNESRPKDRTEPTRRELNPVDGFETALKLAVANVNDLDKPGIKSFSQAERKPSSTDLITNPTTYSIVYLRIQPFTSPSPFSAISNSSNFSTSPGRPSQDQLQFLLHLRDPSHSLSMSTITQSFPARWMELWEQHEWVEDQLAETLRLGVEMLGQEYVVARMRWDEALDDGSGAGSSGTVGAEKDRTEDTDGEFEKVDAHH